MGGSVGLVTDDDEAAWPGGPGSRYPRSPRTCGFPLRDALLAGEDWRAGFSDDLCVGVWLWSRWQPALEPAGCTREDFVEIVVSTHRELWLWLLGDRRWEQYVSGLAGRVLRRLPDPTPPS